ncbi:ankyrin [Westerdykella ornata]|uniref:Ankyrin n=1 Tax=Westerdykella ornata TaxID=318751 RepID=A0A6A6JL94_WESOR|nr:ankyrin [Westerdykella ornata]KAF2276883.1 ankyrin [Westerdykella ornata]
MTVLNAGRALIQAVKRDALADVRACTARLLTFPDARETNPPMKMAMAKAAYMGHANSLRHLMASLPRSHWQGASGPWNPVVLPGPWNPLLDLTPRWDHIPKEWRAAAMSDLVVDRAAAGGVPDVIQALLDAGLAVDHEVDRVGTPLGIAIINRKLELIRFLLAKGADPNGMYWVPPITFLHMAAELGSTTIMELLLDHGAVVQGTAALEGAARVGSIEAAQLLLERGADVNAVLRYDMCDHDGDIIGTALHVAVRHDQEAMVEFLLRRGAKQDSDLLDGDRATVKALAAEKGNPRILHLLQQHET